MSPTTGINIISAFKTVAREKGVTNVTIGDIADKCNCVRQTIYYHCNGVKDLILEVATRPNPNLRTEILDRAMWKHDAENLILNLKENDWLFTNVMQSKYREMFLAFLIQYCEEHIIHYVIAPCLDYGTPRSREYISRMLAYSVSGFITDWINQGFKESPEEMVTELNRLFGTSMNKMIEDYLVLRPLKATA